MINNTQTEPTTDDIVPWMLGSWIPIITCLSVALFVLWVELLIYFRVTNLAKLYLLDFTEEKALIFLESEHGMIQAERAVKIIEEEFRQDLKSFEHQKDNILTEYNLFYLGEESNKLLFTRFTEHLKTRVICETSYMIAMNAISDNRFVCKELTNWRDAVVSPGEISKYNEKIQLFKNRADEYESPTSFRGFDPKPMIRVAEKDAYDKFLNYQKNKNSLHKIRYIRGIFSIIPIIAVPSALISTVIWSARGYPTLTL